MSAFILHHQISNEIYSWPLYLDTPIDSKIVEGNMQ